MRLVFHGILRDLFGESVVMKASSVADAIEGYSSQQRALWPSKVPVMVAGYNSLEEMKAGKPDEVHLVPALQGGGGVGKFVNFILGAAMIVAGILLLSVNPTIGISLIISGSMMIVQGVIQLFMKAPSLDRDSPNDPEGSKYLGINRNTTAVRTPMTMAWGKIKVFPHWLSLQSDSSLMAHGAFPVNPT